MSDSARALRAFGLLLAAKWLVSSAFMVWLVEPTLARTITLLVATLAVVGLARAHVVGALSLLALSTYAVAESFPHTLNHGWFELLASVVLLRAATAPRRFRRRTQVRARLILQLAIVSVFALSALQKLVYGQFLSGEFLLRAALLEPDGLGAAVRAGASWLDVAVPSVDARTLVASPVSVELPTLLRWGAMGAAAAVVAAELVLPIMVLRRVRGARWLLLAAQVGIGLVSGELGFACTGCGAILLLWSRVPWWAWVATFVFWATAAALLWS